jgi:hypothetical protein
MMQAVTTEGLFGQWQPEYAARGIATFPVRNGVKKPAVRGYLKIGLARSRQLAAKFSNNDAFGFVAGRRSNITVMDVDCPDERVLADALDRHGKTPIVVRSGSGNYQAWYRHNGEGRSIRPDRTKPIDYLGGGCVVAPPSRGSTGQYEIIHGKLDDIDQLPTIRAIPATPNQIKAIAPTASWEYMGERSGRNDALYRRLGREAHACDDFGQLLDRAQTLNSQFGVPMDDARVVGVARSVALMTAQGRNRFGQHGVFLPVQDVDRLVGDPYLLALLSWTRAHNGPESQFMIADGLAELLNWPRRRFAKARRGLIEAALVVCVSPRRPGRAARYGWPRQQGSREIGATYVEDRLPFLVGRETAIREPAGPPR